MIIRWQALKAQWVSERIGPLAREALDAIGRPDAQGEINIKQDGALFHLDGVPTTAGDVELVRLAWHADPHPFGEEPSERVVAFVKRSITVRRLLAGSVA